MCLTSPIEGKEVKDGGGGKRGNVIHAGLSDIVRKGQGEEGSRREKGKSSEEKEKRECGDHAE